MRNSSLLEGKKVLIVDDEPDVLVVLEGLLPMCDVSKASNYETAKRLLEDQPFDLAVIDIMGVDGYRLLEIANEKGVIAVMLTAHALKPENVIRSYKEGAASYVPKDKMSHIETYLNDILEAKKEGKNLWWRWLDRFDSFFEECFGANWKDESADKEFWEKIGHSI